MLNVSRPKGGSNRRDSEYPKEINRTDSPQRAGKRQREMDTRKLAELTEVRQAVIIFGFNLKQLKVNN